MKKLKVFLLGIISLLVLPSMVNAASGKISNLYR